jgi:hypothetical protein
MNNIMKQRSWMKFALNNIDNNATIAKKRSSHTRKGTKITCNSMSVIVDFVQSKAKDSWGFEKEISSLDKTVSLQTTVSLQHFIIFPRDN